MRLLPFILTIARIYTLQFRIPDKLVKHIWDNQVLWWVRVEPAFVASLHIADLRSKYSLTGLDLTELRAVWSCLPKSFDNDPGGQKASWRDNCLETIMDQVQKEVRLSLLEFLL